MKKLLAAAALATGLVLATAAPSSAGELCYDVNIEVQGQAPIVQASCIPLG